MDSGSGSDEEVIPGELTNHSMATRRRVPKHQQDIDVMSRFGQYGYDPFADDGDDMMADAGVAGAEPKQEPVKAKVATPVKSKPAPSPAAVAKKVTPPGSPTKAFRAQEGLLAQVLNIGLSTIRLIMVFLVAVPLFLYVFDAHMRQFCRYIWLAVRTRVTPNLEEARVYDFGKYFFVLFIGVIIAVGIFGPQSQGGAGSDVTHSDINRAEAKLNAKIESQRETLNKQGQELNTVQTAQTSANQANDNLAASLKNLAGLHKKLEQSHSATADDLANLRTVVDTVKKSLTEAGDKLKTFGTQKSVDDLSKAVSELQTKLTAVQAALDASSGNTAPSSAITDLVSKLKNLEDSSRKVTTDFTDLQRALADAKTEISADITKINQKIASLGTGGLSEKDLAAKFKELAGPDLAKIHERIDKLERQGPVKPSHPVQVGAVPANLLEVIDARIEVHPHDGVTLPDWAAANIGGVVSKAPRPDIAKHLLPNVKGTLASLANTFGLSKWDKQSMITPGNINCYPIETLPSNVSITLGRPVTVESVTIDHVLRSVSHNQGSTAPYHFRVYGHTQTEVVDLLSTLYDHESPKPVQTFKVYNRDNQAFTGITFQFEDTYQNEDHLCIYRLRVHGKSALVPSKAIATDSA